VKIIDLIKFASDDLKNGIQSIFYKSEIKNKKFTYLRKLFYTLTILFFSLLAITGFSPAIFLGEQLSNVLLIIHVTIAPLFAVSLMLFVIFWALKQQFGEEDFKTAQSLINKKSVEPAQSHIFWNKIYFWLFAVLSLPAILSMIVSMYPIFGTEGQIVLLGVHQYTVLALAIIVAFHLFGRYRLQAETNTSDKKKK
jgi:hypothetical protein